MRKASGITLSVFVMLCVLALLLGLTSFYIDRVSVNPIVVMHDSEVSLKCHFVLSNAVGSEYSRQSDIISEDSLKYNLTQTYGLDDVQQFDYGTLEESFKEALSLTYEDTDINILTNTEYIRIGNFICSIELYGPSSSSIAGLSKGETE